METQQLRISTHNVNGFENSRSFLKSRCTNESDTIQCIQEHWLRPPFRKIKGVTALRDLHEDFDGYGTSAMKKAVQTKILSGRPYGGTGFLWNKKLASSLKPRQEYQHERITVLEILNSRNTILCINAYLPYLNTSNIVEQSAIYHDTIGYIDYIVSSNPGCDFLLLGDFNCNIYDNRHPFTPIVRDLLTRRGLICTFDVCDSIDVNSAYTRTNYGAAGSGTLLDYIFVSRDLLGFINNIEIDHFPDNLSDHLPVTLEITVPVAQTASIKSNYPATNVNWSNVDDISKQKFSDVMASNLAKITVPMQHLLHGRQCCNSNEHIFIIERYYCDIVAAVAAADACLPKARPGVSRGFWNNDLSDLKSASYDAFSLWRDMGKPSSGPVFDIKKNACYQYKLAVRRAKRDFDQNRSDAIHENLETGNSAKFWKSWQALHGKQRDSPRINGKILSRDIANEFAMNFKKIYDDANSAQANVLSDKFDTVYQNCHSSHGMDDISREFLSWDDIVGVMSKLKPGKASGSFIKSEHILFGCPQLTIHLHLLFNSMIQHGYVPNDFLKGVISPIIKDAGGDASSLDNYRGITLSHVFAYLFEHAILLKTQIYLSSDNLQFGYKKNHSITHAIYCLKQCINHFCKHGSNVYASFLDCSKGFDRVCHRGLFLKLIERGMPYCWVRVLLYWYSNLFSICKWKDSLSDPFPVIAGVRQGGVLSAQFWAVYMDDLITILRKSGIGCHMIEMFVACIMYADDVCLLAPTLKSMQSLLDMCSDYAKYWCIRYNETKTKAMYFGKGFKHFSCQPLLLNSKPIEFVPEWKYLGVTIVAEKEFLCSVKKIRANFYRSSNSILNVLKRPSEPVLMKLLYSISVPNVTYACEVSNYHYREKESLHVAVNDAIRRIFSYNRWESIRSLRTSLGYLSVTEIFAKRKASFESNLSNSENSVLRALSDNESRMNL